LLGVGGVISGGGAVLADIQGGNVSFGTVLKAANTLQNARGLTSSGIGGELLSGAIGAIGRTTGVDVSGVANVAFPKGGGGGGGLGTLLTAGLAVGGASLLANSGSSGASTSSTSSSDANANSGPDFSSNDYIGP
jgi:hypothetical protein